MADLLYTEQYQLLLKSLIPAAGLNGDGDWPFYIKGSLPGSVMDFISSKDKKSDKAREPLVGLLFTKFFFRASSINEVRKIYSSVLIRTSRGAT